MGEREEIKNEPMPGSFIINEKGEIVPNEEDEAMRERLKEKQEDQNNVGE